MAGGSESLVGLLDALHDLAEPAPVSMAPATPAWGVLAALLLAALAAGGVAFLRHWRATAWRREALDELAVLAPGLRAGDPAALAALQTLLRSVALATAPRAEVAALSGAGWAGYLAASGADFGPLGATLAQAPYRPAASYDGAAMLQAARAWIRHRRPASPEEPRDA